jgi:hypothetical protein
MGALSGALGRAARLAPAVAILTGCSLVYPTSDHQGGDATDGAPGCDQDGDGFTADTLECGGDDCDDTDATVYPGAPAICGDGKVNDCRSPDYVNVRQALLGMSGGEIGILPVREMDDLRFEVHRHPHLALAAVPASGLVAWIDGDGQPMFRRFPLDDPRSGAEVLMEGLPVGPYESVALAARSSTEAIVYVGKVATGTIGAVAAWTAAAPSMVSMSGVVTEGGAFSSPGRVSVVGSGATMALAWAEDTGVESRLVAQTLPDSGSAFNPNDRTMVSVPDAFGNSWIDTAGTTHLHWALFEGGRYLWMWDVMTPGTPEVVSLPAGEASRWAVQYSHFQQVPGPRYVLARMTWDTLELHEVDCIDGGGPCGVGGAVRIAHDGNHLAVAVEVRWPLSLIPVLVSRSGDAAVVLRLHAQGSGPVVEDDVPLPPLMAVPLPPDSTWPDLQVTSVDDGEAVTVLVGVAMEADTASGTFGAIGGLRACRTP